MTADRYVLLQLQKGATIHECQDCGTVTFHRAIHDAWHEVNEAEAFAIARLLEQYGRALWPMPGECAHRARLIRRARRT
jgi:hypothetical protein